MMSAIHWIRRHLFMFASGYLLPLVTLTQSLDASYHVVMVGRKIDSMLAPSLYASHVRCRRDSRLVRLLLTWYKK